MLVVPQISKHFKLIFKHFVFIDFILEKNAPSSLLSCLNNEFGFDMEVMISN